MRGHLRQRSKGSWTLILDVGTDGERKQRWITVRGTKGEAQTRLTAELAAIAKGEYVDFSKATFGAWLDQWLESASERLRPTTIERYRGLIERHVKPELGSVPLQKLRATRIESFYQAKRETLSRSSLSLIHVIVSSSLASAERKRLVHGNEARLVENRPKGTRPNDTDSIRQNVWTPDEARRFLAVAEKAGPQPEALYALALELGLRRNEISALRWEDFDDKAGTIRVLHQLDRRGGFAPLKAGRPRALDASTGLVSALVNHRRHQSERKLRNGRAYDDRGFLFAVELAHGKAKLGDPLSMVNVASRDFPKLIAAAKVKPITFHGLRHTSATLALAAGIPVKVVSERLGHAKTAITLDLYSHVVPALSQDAAARIGALLHG